MNFSLPHENRCTVSSMALKEILIQTIKRSGYVDLTLNIVLY